MADEIDLDPTTSGVKHETLEHYLALRDLAQTVQKPCTDKCGRYATAFLGYIQGTTLDRVNRPNAEDDTEPEDSPTYDVPLYALDSFVRSCAPPNLASVLGGFTQGEIGDWFIYNGDEESLRFLIRHTRNECFPEFCRSLTWRGNPDVSGIGVDTAFIIQAVFATIFLFIYIGFQVSDTMYFLDHFEKGDYEQPNPENGTSEDPTMCNPSQAPTQAMKISELRKAFDDCLELFWSTCYVFAFTLVIAALTFNAVYRSEGHIYSGYFGYLGAVHSVAVLLCLWPWFPGRTKYPVLTFSGLVVLLLLVTGVSITFFSETKSPENKTTFESVCLEGGHSTHYVQGLVKYTPYATLALIIFWGSSLFVIRRIRLSFVCEKTDLDITKMSRGALSLYLAVTGVLGGFLVLSSLAIVWVFLVFFMYLRNKVRRLSGPSYAEDEWGFGQVVAVVAWIPLLGQFSAIVVRKLFANQYLTDHAKKWFEPVPEHQRRTPWIIANALRKTKSRAEETHLSPSPTSTHPQSRQQSVQPAQTW